MFDVLASQVSFKTRYALTPIDSETGLATGATVHVLNMVLDSGLVALGSAVAYSSVSIGTSRLSADPAQIGLIGPVGRVELPQSTITHENVSTAEGVTSRITHEVIFKAITFPSSEREININEVGLTGVTRAVLPEPLTIGLKDWVAVSAIIEYSYTSSPVKVFAATVNGEESKTESVKFSTTAVSVVDDPDNRTGRGWGSSGAVTCRLWDGSELHEAITPANIPGVSISAKLDAANHQWVYTMRGAYNALNQVKGVVIHDSINGVMNLIKFEAPLAFEEDDSIELTFTFKWSR